MSKLIRFLIIWAGATGGLLAGLHLLVGIAPEDWTVMIAGSAALALLPALGINNH